MASGIRSCGIANTTPGWCRAVVVAPLICAYGIAVADDADLIRLVDFGIYSADRDNRELLLQAEEVPATVGTVFGVRVSANADRAVEYDFRWTFPRMQNPSDGRVWTEMTGTRVLDGDGPHEFMVRINNDWEAIPGDWTIRVSQDDLVIFEKSFRVYALSNAVGGSVYLYRLDSVDKTDVDCGCTFFRSRAEGDIDLYFAGSEILFFDYTSDPPRALVNFGQGNVELYLEEQSSLPINSCEPGESFSTLWRLDELAMATHVIAAVKDGAACWFGGKLRVEQSGSNMGGADLSGACQC